MPEARAFGQLPTFEPADQHAYGRPGTVRGMVAAPRTLACSVALLACWLLGAPLAQAQAVPDRFAFEVQDVVASVPLPADGTPLVVQVPWTMSCAEPAPAPESALPPQAPAVTLEGTGLPFHLAGVAGLIQLPDCATISSTRGQLNVSLAALPGAEGERPQVAALRVQVAPEGALPPTTSSSKLEAAVAWSDRLEVATPVVHAEAGPQKLVHFPLQLHVDGNALAEVHFEVVGEVPSGWSPIAPTPVVIDPREGHGNQTVVFLVSTPHRNGPNDEATDLHLRAWVTSPRRPELRSEPVDLTVKAEVHGPYIPAVSPFVLAVALAAVAAVARRARAA